MQNAVAERADMHDAVTGLLNELRDAVGGVSRMAMLKGKAMLTPAEVEELFGIPVSTLSTKRSRGGGPDYHQLADDGGKILYNPEDVRSWLANRHRKG